MSKYLIILFFCVCGYSQIITSEFKEGYVEGYTDGYFDQYGKKFTDKIDLNSVYTSGLELDPKFIQQLSNSIDLSYDETLKERNWSNGYDLGYQDAYPCSIRFMNQVSSNFKTEIKYFKNIRQKLYDLPSEIEKLKKKIKKEKKANVISMHFTNILIYQNYAVDAIANCGFN